jgi:hypothetical protein
VSCGGMQKGTLRRGVVHVSRLLRSSSMCVSVDLTWMLGSKVEGLGVNSPTLAE